MNEAELVNTVLFGLVLGLSIPVLLKILFTGSCDYRGYEERVRELREKLRETVGKYEALLKETAVRNEMMRGLWKAWSTGKLRECIREGGDPRVLADGVVVCDKGESAKSYAIALWEEETYAGEGEGVGGE